MAAHRAVLVAGCAMTPPLYGVMLFALAMLSLFGGVACMARHPRIALAFESTAFGCVFGMVLCVTHMARGVA
jgi:hypothetical protein